MIFETDHTYTDILQTTFGGISDAKLYRILQDGRGSAWLFYGYLLEKYENLREFKFEDYPADFVVLPDRRIFQVRMVTDAGVALNQHKGNGVGRRPDAIEHRRNHKRISGFILVDITEAPTYQYASISIDKIPENFRLSREECKI